MYPPIRHAALVMALLALPVAAAPATDAGTIARQGNGTGAPACATCHGVDGGGQAAAGFPRLAGLDATYLFKQLNDFSNGTRDNAVMKPIATALDESERKAMAAYYSGMPIPTAARSPASTLDADGLGAQLATRGRWDQQVPGCVQCHGPNGVGVGANFPALAGQPATYIAAQLNDWKRGARHNDPLELMQHVVAALDAQDIEAVSSWFAAQPPDGTEATP